MEHRSLLRLFGLCSFVGGLLLALLQIWFYFDSISFIATYFDHVGWAFITFGSVGLYLVQYRETRGLGFVSFLALSLGMFQWLGYKWFLTFTAPDLRRSAPELLDSGLQSVLYGIELSNYFLQTSFFLFAVISLFKGVLSRWGTSLLLIGSALAFNLQMEEVVFYSPIIPQAMIGFAFAWIGCSLFMRDHENTYEEIMAENPMEEVLEWTNHSNEKRTEANEKMWIEEHQLQKEASNLQDVVDTIQVMEESNSERKQEISTS